MPKCSDTIAAFPALSPVPSCRSDSRITLSIRAAVAPVVKPLAEATRLDIDAGLLRGGFACISCTLAAIFLPPCPWPAPRASLAPGHRSPTKGRRRRPPSGYSATRASARRLRTSPRTCCARKASPISATCASWPVDAVARGEIDFGLKTPGMDRLPSGCRRADHGVGGRASRVLRAVRAGARPNHQRLEGQEGRHPRGARLERAPAPRDHGGAGRARPAQGHRLDRQPTGERHGAIRRRADRCFSRLSARAAGAARPQDRSRDPQHGHGQAMVAVSLLHGGRQQGVRPRSIRSRPSASCAPSSRPPTSALPSRSGRRNVWSMAGSPSATTTRSRR